MKRWILILFIINLLIVPCEGYTLHGTVLNTNNNIVPSAEVRVECQNFSKDLISDKFGSFNLEINEDDCIISAKKESSIGYKKIKSINEDFLHIDIKMDKLILKKKINIYIILTLFLVLLLLFGFIIKNKLKSLKRSSLFEGLREKEKIILNEIKNQRGKTTQAKIYYVTKIPKVSLSRYIKSLENKKLIETEKWGKLKKIRFSKKLKRWF